MVRFACTRLLAAAGLVALLLLALSSVAAAECSVFDPWPRFTTVAPAATHIAIVEVVRIVDEREPDDPRPPLRYRVRTIENVRGSLPVRFTLSHAWTTNPSHECIPYQLNAAPGDRLALAYGVPNDYVRGWLSAAAFVGHGFDAPPGTNVIDRNYKMQVLSARQVRRYASLSATDTAPAPSDDPLGPITQWLRLLGGAGAWLWSLPR